MSACNCCAQGACNPGDIFVCGWPSFHTPSYSNRGTRYLQRDWVITDCGADTGSSGSSAYTLDAATFHCHRSGDAEPGWPPYWYGRGAVVDGRHCVWEAGAFCPDFQNTDTLSNPAPYYLVHAQTASMYLRVWLSFCEWLIVDGVYQPGVETPLADYEWTGTTPTPLGTHAHSEKIIHTFTAPELSAFGESAVLIKKYTCIPGYVPPDPGLTFDGFFEPPLPFGWGYKYGCTSMYAANYSPSATHDDGSCAGWPDWY